MKRFFLLISVALVLVSCAGDKTVKLPRNDNSGIDTQQFDKLFEDISYVGSTCEMHGVVVLKDGKVIYEKYDPAHGPEIKHSLWSASKTFTGLAIGFAEEEGLLSVTDPIIKFFSADELPEEPCEYLQEMTIWNLLTMTSGFAHDYLGNAQTNACGKASVTMLHDDFAFEPGTVFKYNSMNSYMLSAIVTKVTGKKMVDYLAEKLFKPLGIADYHWDESNEGYNYGGWGLFLRTEDFAKAGQLFLQKGEWNGKQLISPEWIAEAMSEQVSPLLGQEPAPQQVNMPMRPMRQPEEDWFAGYGYQMWKCDNGTYRFDGAWGQFCVISEEKNVVIAINEMAGGAQNALRYVWKDIYDKI